METANTIKKFKYRQKETKNVYGLAQITKTIMLPISAVGKNIHLTIERVISSMVEGKCIVEGYVKPKSTKVISFSSGIIQGNNISFVVIIECEVCFPVEGMLISCVVKNITKAGIRAESSEESPSPFVLFIARDHFYSNDYFNSIEENDKFVARVIAQRFELNDKYVSVIAEPVSPKDDKFIKKPRLQFDEE